MEPLHFTTQDQLKLSDLNKVALEEDANKVTEPYSSQRVDEYKNHFQIIPANDNELKQHCYRIRHDVYCRELGYEPTNQAEIEVDEHDQHSVHCLIRATHSSQFIGCARLVVKNPSDTAVQLPFEKTCEGSLAPGIDEFIKQNQDKIAEVSRVAVISTYRRGRVKCGKTIQQQENGIEPSKYRLPNLTLGLYLALTILARQQGIQHLFFLIDGALASSLEHHGWEMWQVGTPVNLNGCRIPYIVNLERNIFNMSPFIRSFYEAISMSLLTYPMSNAPSRPLQKPHSISPPHC